MLRSIRQISILLALLVLSMVLAACNAAAGSGGSAAAANVAQVPAGKAYAEGKEVFFSHTEASDPAIAEMLTNMMDSPVLHVPALADVPASSLATVYVFENGAAGSGPLGFQPDVFDNPPGTPGYSPLRRLVMVQWAAGAEPRELKSAAEVEQAAADGELTTTESDVVVNMPFMVWDGGKR